MYSLINWEGIKDGTSKVQALHQQTSLRSTLFLMDQ